MTLFLLGEGFVFRIQETLDECTQIPMAELIDRTTEMSKINVFFIQISVVLRR